MSTEPAHHLRGLGLAALGGLVLTVDIPLIRLADGDSWSVLLVRSSTTLAVVLALWAVTRLAGWRLPPLIPGRAGLVVAGLYGLSSICFILAVHRTSTANLVFILAFTTAFSAILSWIFLKQRPANATLAAIAVMILGVLIIVQDGMVSGRFAGDLLSFCAALLISSAITLSRWSGRDMGFASLVGAAPAALLAALIVVNQGFDVAEPGWVLLDGALIMPIAFFCLANAPRYLSAPEVAMFYLLETVLAPIWVWLVFTETPSTASLIGGSILIAALLAHSLWQILSGRRQRAAARALRHPV